jgi:hypothetical protein
LEVRQVVAGADSVVVVAVGIVVHRSRIFHKTKCRFNGESSNWIFSRRPLQVVNTLGLTQLTVYSTVFGQ